jgi:hypothetical protein
VAAADTCDSLITPSWKHFTIGGFQTVSETQSFIIGGFQTVSETQSFIIGGFQTVSETQSITDRTSSKAIQAMQQCSNSYLNLFVVFIVKNLGLYVVIGPVPRTVKWMLLLRNKESLKNRIKEKLS